MIKNNKIIVILVLFITIVFLFELLLKLTGYKLVFQTDYSVNFRFAIMKKANKISDFKKGDYISFQFLAVKDDPRYGWSFVKKVTCMPGEYIIYSIEDNTFYCNGMPVASPKPYSKTGKRLYPFMYGGKVPEGKLFVTGETYHSYDSRYWGFIDEAWIQGKVSKLL
jgi:signal peptidase I